MEWNGLNWWSWLDIYTRSIDLWHLLDHPTRHKQTAGRRHGATQGQARRADAPAAGEPAGGAERGDGGLVGVDEQGGGPEGQGGGGGSHGAAQVGG